MIRFNGRNEKGRLLLGFGISEENVRRMKEGKPIHIHADAMGFTGEILIFYGETEDAIAKQLLDNGFVDKDVVRDQRDEKKN